MKKTMLALMATVGLAFGAKAVLPTTTGFETGYDLGSLNLANLTNKYEWSAATTNGLAATSLVCTVTEYADNASKPTNLPDAFADAGDKYLAVDTSGDVLYRNVNDRTTDDTTVFGAAQLIGEGLFFDSDVQFTATDSTSTPIPTGDDKLIVWLSGDEDGATNLIVTAATGYNAYGARQGIANYTNNNPAVSVGDNEWHRLTVAAANANDMTTFKVYVDGELVTAEGVTDGNFKSLVGSGDNRNYNTLTAAGFMGTGALDNLVWTTEDPFYVEPPTTVALTVNATGEDYSSLVYIVGESTTTNEVDGTAASIEAAVDDVVTFVLTVADGYTPAVTGYELQKGEEQVDEFSDVYYPYTFTAKVTQAMIDGGLTLAINVTENGGGSDVPTSGEAEPGKSATVKAANAVEAEAAVSVKVDDTVAAALTAEQKDAFAAAFFNKTATANGDGTFTVSVTVNEDAVEDALDEVIEEALETASDGEITTIPAGLCYKIESGSTVSLGTEKKGVSDGKPIEVEGLSEAAGFYKVTLDVKPIE